MNEGPVIKLYHRGSPSFVNPDLPLYEVTEEGRLLQTAGTQN